jgi:hypothetical protein
MEGPVQEPIQDHSRSFPLGGDLIGSLDLPQDLRLPHNHGIEAGCDPEDMLHGPGPHVGIKMALKFLQGELMVPAEEIFQMEGGFLSFSGDGKDLHPIAGGENHIFLEGRKGLNLAEGLLHVLLFEG